MIQSNFSIPSLPLSLSHLIVTLSRIIIIIRLIPREIVIAEKIHLVCLLDLTTDFGVKTNAKLTPIFKL